MKEKLLILHYKCKHFGRRRLLLCLFLAVFFLASVVPVAGLLIAGPAAPAANEAKASAPKLTKWDGSLNTAYLSDLAGYVSKGFWLRLECITGWSRLGAEVFASSTNEEVILGPDGWLFYYTAAEQVSGADRMSERELWCCARSLYLMQRYCQEQGARFLFLSPNGKYDLYPEHLRSYVTVAEGRNIDALQSLLDGMGVAYCDMYQLFAEQEETLYWAYDSHWNGKGAALAADGVLAALGRESDFFGGGFTAAEPHSGDLYVMLFPAGRELEADYLPESGFSFVYESNFRDVNDIDILTAKEGGEGSLLMYRDSFGRNLYPYLAESFGAAEFSRLNNYELYRIPERGATDVVIELGEKNLYYLLKYPAVYPSVERDYGLLTDTLRLDCAVTVETENTGLPGYAKLTGSTGETAADASVFLRVDDRVYEAIPGDGCFTAYVDSALDFSSVEVYVSSGAVE